MTQKLLSTIKANPQYFAILRITGLVFVVFGLLTTLKSDDFLYPYLCVWGRILVKKKHHIPRFYRIGMECFFIFIQGPHRVRNSAFCHRLCSDARLFLPEPPRQVLPGDCSR